MFEEFCLISCFKNEFKSLKILERTILKWKTIQRETKKTICLHATEESSNAVGYGWLASRCKVTSSSTSVRCWLDGPTLNYLSDSASMRFTRHQTYSKHYLLCTSKIRLGNCFYVLFRSINCEEMNEYRSYMYRSFEL